MIPVGLAWMESAVNYYYFCSGVQALSRTSPKGKKKTWGSTRGPTEIELELQPTAVGLQPTAVGCNRRRRGSSPKGRPLSNKKGSLSLRGRPGLRYCTGSPGGGRHRDRLPRGGWSTNTTPGRPAWVFGWGRRAGSGVAVPQKCKAHWT